MRDRRIGNIRNVIRALRKQTTVLEETLRSLTRPIAGWVTADEASSVFTAVKTSQKEGGVLTDGGWTRTEGMTFARSVGDFILLAGESVLLTDPDGREWFVEDASVDEGEFGRMLHLDVMLHFSELSGRSACGMCRDEDDDHDEDDDYDEDDEDDDYDEDDEDDDYDEDDPDLDFFETTISFLIIEDPEE